MTDCAGQCGNTLTGKQTKWCSAQCRQDFERSVRLMADFGLTEAEYLLIFEEQNGVCAICKKPPKENRRLAVDHDHGTGAVRGLLCFLCNKIILGARTAEQLISAAAYVTDPPATRALGREVIAPNKAGRKRKRKRKKVSAK
jgi:hypothetical protein